MVVRAFVPGAERVAALAEDGRTLCELSRTDPAGLFEGLAPVVAYPPPRYRLACANAGGEWSLLDPYAFGPVLGPLDDHLLVEGTQVVALGRLVEASFGERV